MILLTRIGPVDAAACPSVFSDPNKVPKKLNGTWTKVLKMI